MSKKMQEEFFEDVSYTTYSLLLGAFMYIDNIDDAFLPPEIKSIKRQIEKIFIKVFDSDEAEECIESGLIVKKRFGLILLPDGTCYKDGQNIYVRGENNKPVFVPRILQFKFPSWEPSKEIREELKKKEEHQQKKLNSIKKEYGVGLNYPGIKEEEPILYWQIKQFEKKTKNLPAPKESYADIYSSYCRCQDAITPDGEDDPNRKTKEKLFSLYAYKINKNIKTWWTKYYGAPKTDHIFLYVYPGEEKKFLDAFKNIIAVGKEIKEENINFYGFSKNSLNQKLYLYELRYRKRYNNKRKTGRYIKKMDEVFNQCLPYVHVLNRTTFEEYLLTGKKDLIPEFLQETLDQMNIKKKERKEKKNV